MTSSSAYPDFFEKGDPVCRQVDPDLFFPERDDEDRSYKLKAAKSLCGKCVYQAECLTWALDNNEEYGVWGGTTEDERRRMKRKVILNPPRRWSGAA